MFNATNRVLNTIQSNSEGTTTAIDRIHVKSTAFETWTGSADITLGNVSKGIEDIKSTLDALTPAIQQLEKSQHHELSNLENILESAVLRGLKRHNDELRRDRGPKLEEAAASKQALLDTCYKSENGFNSYSMTHRLKSIHRSRFQTPIFDIEFVTKEVQRRPVSSVQSRSTAPSQQDITDSQRYTTYEVRIKMPYWGSGMSLEQGTLHRRYSISFDKCFRFRIYNIVAWESPIIQACRNFDLPEVRRLFEAGEASPQDHCHPLNESLVGIVFFWACFQPRKESLQPQRELNC